MLASAFAQAPNDDSRQYASPSPTRGVITQAIDESHLVVLKGTVPALARPEADQGTAPDSLPIGRTMLMLNTTAAQQASLTKLLNDQQNPKSPNYHKWLQPQEFGTQFGAAPEDIEKITQWLERYGFSVEPLMAGHNLIIFSGTHGQLKAAFHTELHSYKSGGQMYWANATDPQIPVALSGVIRGFSSLNNFPRKAQHSTPQLIRHNKTSWKPATGSAKLQAQFTTTDEGQIYHVIGPSDLATIYNIQPLLNSGINGSDQTIAIVSDSDINPADVDYFRTTFGLPAKKLNIFYYGNNPGATGNEGEADLDVEWAGAVATQATIDLVVAADGATSGGVDGAAVYAINNNVASILNVSYGVCEYGIGTAGNAFYAQAWQQAAAQGITVTVSTGDAGSAVCDTHAQFAEYGLSVNAIASTPYNVAIGGTDFYASFMSPDTYWNATNDALTLSSAKSYIPETPWNDSCASPEVFAVLQANGGRDATREAVCNDPLDVGFLTTAAGSGGASNCSTGNATQCISGYAKPAWQSGVAGIPADGVRDLPDVSLMAGNGLWGSFYVYCQSDAAPGGACDVNNAIQGAGGTSFASPIFAGMMALVQQKTNSQQGNVNYVLYKLAAAQSKADGSSCQTSNATNGNSCKFYDITEGTVAVPCYTGSSDCKPSVSTDPYGILPGYDAVVGYDLASGLGTINAFNLVEGWNSASTTFLPTTSTISAVQSTAIYGAPFAVNVAAAAVAPATGTPSGDVGVISNSAAANSISIADTTLAAGAGAINIPLLPTGTYQLFARYAGDATFAPSLSSGLTVTVTPGAASLSLIASRSSVQPGQKVTLSLSLGGPSYGAAPTGTVVFTDATNGAVLGTETVAAGASMVSTPASIAYVTISSTQLQPGTNSITATYSGDANYQATGAATISVSLASTFTTSITPGSVTITPSGNASVTVTATPNGAFALDPSALRFACPATTPAGLSCMFSSPVAASGGAVTSTLSLQTVSPLYAKPKALIADKTSHDKWLGLGTVTASASLIMFGFVRRKRRLLQGSAMLIMGLLSSIIGCGGTGSGTETAPALIATTTAVSVSSANPAINTPVTITARVTPSSGSGSATGTVSFSSGTTMLGTTPLSAGSAVLISSNLAIGRQAISATYSGDSTYAKSQSAVTNVDVVFSTTIAVAATDKAGNSSSSNLLVTIQ
jgi:hypothetical protein